MNEQTDLNKKTEQETEVVAFKSFADINLYLDTDELLVPDEESLHMDVMIEKRQQDLIAFQDNFDVWYDKITRRRMFARARLRKLTNAHKNRIKFYENVKLEMEKKNGAGLSLGESPIFSSVSRSSDSTNIEIDSRLSNTEKHGRLPSTDSEITLPIRVPDTGRETAENERNTENRVISTIDNSSRAGNDKQVDRLSKSEDDVNKIKTSEKVKTPFIDEMTYKT